MKFTYLSFLSGIVYTAMYTRKVERVVCSYTLSPLLHMTGLDNMSITQTNCLIISTVDLFYTQNIYVVSPVMQCYQRKPNQPEVKECIKMEDKICIIISVLFCYDYFKDFKDTGPDITLNSDERTNLLNSQFVSI